jgi:O-antigen/teichoic acid export membrane protein
MQYILRLTIPKNINRTAVYTLLDQIVVSGSSFALSLLLAKWLGLAAFGVYALLTMVVLVALSISQAYIVQPMLTFWAQKTTTEQPAYYAAVERLQWLVAAGLSAAVLAVMQLIYLPKGSEISLTTTTVLAAVVGTTVLADFYRKGCFAKAQPAEALRYDAAQQAVLWWSLWALWFYDALAINRILFVVVIANVVWVLAGMAGREKTQVAPIYAVAKTHWTFGQWLVATAVLQWLSGNFFVVAAGSVLGTAAVGAVRIAQSLMGVLHLLFLVLENNLPVQAAAAFRTNGTAGMVAAMRRVVLPVGAAVFALLIAVGIAAPYLMQWFYGATIAAYSGVITAFCGVYVLVFIGIPLRIALRTMHRTRPIFIAYLIGAAFSLLCANWLLTQWGLTGFFVGLLLTQMINLVVYAIALFIRRAIAQR